MLDSFNVMSFFEYKCFITSQVIIIKVCIFLQNYSLHRWIFTTPQSCFLPLCSQSCFPVAEQLFQALETMCWNMTRPSGCKSEKWKSEFSCTLMRPRANLKWQLNLRGNSLQWGLWLCDSARGGETTELNIEHIPASFSWGWWVKMPPSCVWNVT